MAVLDTAAAWGTGAGGGGGGGGGTPLPRIPPGDCCCPGEPLPNGTPPGAFTILSLHAVDGGSSSALSGRSRLPLTHRAAISECALRAGEGGFASAISSGPWTALHVSCGRSGSSPVSTPPNNSHPSSPDRP